MAGITQNKQNRLILIVVPIPREIDFHPAGKYMFKVSNRNTRRRCETTYFTICSSVSIVNFEQVNAGWARSSWKEMEMSIVII